MTLPATMRALLLNEDGYTTRPSGSVLEAMEPYVTPGTIAVPTPKASQVLIKVALASINPSDVMFIKGMYGQPRAKGQPAGFEGVGEVVAAGEDAGAQKLVGKRVAFATGISNWGAWAEYAVAEASACLRLIDGVKDVDGAAMIVNPLTAIAMFDIVKQEGEKAFILTAAASQLCKLIMGIARDEGYRPIAIVRRDDQIPLLEKAGAAIVLNAESPDFKQRLAETCKAEKAAHLPRCRDRAAGGDDFQRDAAACAVDHLRASRPDRDADSGAGTADLHAQEGRGILADGVDAIHRPGAQGRGRDGGAEALRRRAMVDRRDRDRAAGASYGTRRSGTREAERKGLHRALTGAEIQGCLLSKSCSL